MIEPFGLIAAALATPNYGGVFGIE